MMDGIQCFDGDGTRPRTRPRKEALKTDFDVYVAPLKGKETWDTRQPGNRFVRPPHDGWGVWGPDRRSGQPLHKAESMKKAQAWAAERYSIAGWKKLHHMMCAIPGMPPKD